MKKAYAKPTATKVDFEYKDNVIAQSTGEPIGSEARPFHHEHCQYKLGTNCTIIYDSQLGCERPIYL